MPKVIRKSHASIVDSRREVFHTVNWQVQVRAGAWSPPTDVYETEENYIVRVEIAGMREEDFEIIAEDNYLWVGGSRPDIPERRAYHQMEIRFGKFETIIGLPGPIDLENAKAVYENGFLTVNLPKAHPNEIHIEEETS